VIAFGLFGGIAFSAAYQLVARFANKNVIALGLGCSASGPLVLLLELALEMGPNPTHTQLVSSAGGALMPCSITQAPGRAASAAPNTLLLRLPAHSIQTFAIRSLIQRNG
jgi:hypothetical protein